MFLREPDFQSRLQIQGGQLANLFFKLQMLGYMFASADRRLSADSALNKREPPRRPPVGNMTGTVAVSMSVSSCSREGVAACVCACVYVYVSRACVCVFPTMSVCVRACVYELRASVYRLL